MKRILIVQNEFAVSGSPVAAFNLACYLKKSGYSISVVSPNMGPMQQWYLKEEIPAKVVPNLANDPQIMFDNSVGFDLAIVFCLPQFSAVLGLLNAKIPTIFSIHEAQIAGMDIVKDNLFAQKALTKASALVFNSQYCVNLYSHKHENKNVYKIPIGTEELIPETVEKPERPYFIMAGSVEYRKGQDVAIHAFKALADKADLYIAGRMLDQNYFLQLQQIAQGAENVKFVGEMLKGDIRSVMSKSSGLIVSSRDETLPNVILEAMMNNTPVIATDVGAIREVIRNRDTGLLIQNEHAGELLNAVNTILTDKALAKKMTFNARALVKESRTIEAYGSKFLELVQKLLQTT